MQNIFDLSCTSRAPEERDTPPHTLSFFHCRPWIWCVSAPCGWHVWAACTFAHREGNKIWGTRALSRTHQTHTARQRWSIKREFLIVNLVVAQDWIAFCMDTCSEYWEWCKSRAAAECIYLSRGGSAGKGLQKRVSGSNKSERGNCIFPWLMSTCKVCALVAPNWTLQQEVIWHLCAANWSFYRRYKMYVATKSIILLNCKHPIAIRYILDDVVLLFCPFIFYIHLERFEWNLWACVLV